MTATTQVAFEDDLDYEIVNGQREVKMAGARHGSINAQVIVKLGVYLEQHPIGKLYTSNTTFQIGANERMPDVGFVSSPRIPAEGEPSGKWEIPPDLAVEIISPNDMLEKVIEKIHEYFAAGVKQVWLVSQKAEEVYVYDSPTQIRVVPADQELTSETLLPGFKCRVSALFQS
jgi:Uma2 family endonuclease